VESLTRERDENTRPEAKIPRSFPYCLSDRRPSLSPLNPPFAAILSIITNFHFLPRGRSSHEARANQRITIEEMSERSALLPLVEFEGAPLEQTRRHSDVGGSFRPFQRRAPTRLNGRSRESERAKAPKSLSPKESPRLRGSAGPARIHVDNFLQIPRRARALAILQKEASS